MTDLNEAKFIEKLNRHLAKGGVIAFPTDTVWGLGALPTKAGADALYEIKHRPREKHLIIMSNALENLCPYMRDMPATAITLAKKHWPGALTLAREIAAGDTMVFGGVRVPNYKPFHELCSVIDGHCLATTSANISGQPPLTNAIDIQKTFPDIIVIDNAYLPMGGAPSTIAVVSENDIRIVRQGAVKL